MYPENSTSLAKSREQFIVVPSLSLPALSNLHSYSVLQFYIFLSPNSCMVKQNDLYGLWQNARRGGPLSVSLISSSKLLYNDTLNLKLLLRKNECRALV